MIVNLSLRNDADFVRAFVLSLAVPDWDATLLWLTGNKVAYAGQVWVAVANSTNVTPGSDGTKWALSSSPLDLTGSTLLYMARASADDAYAPVSLTTVGSAGITVTDAANGKFTLTIPISALAAMKPGAYVHSLIRVRPDGLREEVWHGTLTLQTGPVR
jgi:hypothetical protein